VCQRAAELLEVDGQDDQGANVEKAVKRAKAEIEAERAEAERRSREEAEKRAKAEAAVRYSQHAFGVGAGADVQPSQASAATYSFLAMLGMDVKAAVGQKKAGRMIDMLKRKVPREEVARLSGLAEGDWEPVGPTLKQQQRLRQLRVPVADDMTGWDASQFIGAAVKPDEFEQRKLADIGAATDGGSLTAVAIDIGRVRGVLPPDRFNRLLEAGRQRRQAIRG
jgi:hypothetical protein